MLYHIFYPLAANVKLFNIFKYLTFRTIYAMITALIVCFILGPWIIRKLESLQARQVFALTARNLICRNRAPRLWAAL